MLVGEPPVAVPMKVAIGSKYAVQESISKLAKLVQFVPFPDDESGFKALMNREVGAAIMAQPIADHLEAKNDIAFRRSPMNFVYVVGYGCQVSEVTMCRILSKGVESITPHEKKLLERTFYVKPIEPIVDPIKYEPS